MYEPFDDPTSPTEKGPGNGEGPEEPLATGSPAAVTYELMERTPIRISVFDVTGRLVRILVDASVESGLHTAVWDGNDLRGRPAPTGVYLYRIGRLGHAARSAG